MLCCLNLKDRIVHHIGLIRFIGDRPYNDEGNAVEVCGLRDSRAFHLCTVSVVGIDQALFHFRLVDELIAGDDPAAEHLQGGIDFAADSSCFFGKRFVRLEREDVHLRDLARRIAECDGVHIMVDHVGGDDDVSDIDVRVQRTGNPGVNDGIHSKVIDQDLGADGGIDFADAAPHDNRFHTVQYSGAEFHLRFFDDRGSLHLLF